MMEKCYFCQKEKAEVRVRNKVGAEFDVCRQHAGLALNKGYEFVSAQHSVHLTAFGVELREKFANMFSGLQSLFAKIGGR
jgi:hypothetical protein